MEDFVKHPGTTIGELMEERGISLSRLAELTGLTEKYLRGLLEEDPRYRIGHEDAEKLETGLGTPGRLWLRMQAYYDKARATRHPRDEEKAMTPDRLAEIERVHAAATEGPWWSDQDDQVYRLHGVGRRIPSPLGGEQIQNKQILKAAKRNTPYAAYWPDDADAKLIENAWLYIGELLAEVRRLGGGEFDER